MLRTLIKAALVALLLLACSQLFAAAHGQGSVPQPAPDGDAARGRRIYFEGEDGTTEEMQVLLGNEEIEAPASAFACVNCHAADGQGTTEGGVRPAPVTWEALTAARTSALTGRPRPPYDAKTLTRALRLGVNSANERLHLAMPRYRLTDRQAADLVAFLKILGTDADTDPGVSTDTIKVGAALPLTGQFTPVGEAARATLTAYFADANARGGIYGRRFELIVADSGGTPTGTLQATRELLESRGVFALVGSFEPPGGAGEAGEYLKRKAVPLVGPLALSHVPPAVPNPSLFYLLPTARHQAAALIEYIREEAARVETRSAIKLAVLNADDEFDSEAAEGARAQLAVTRVKAGAVGAQPRPLTLVLSKRYGAGEFAAAPFAAEVARAGAEYVLFFGNSTEFAALARELERQHVNVRLAGLTLVIGREALSLPPAQAARTFLAHPTPLPERADLAEFSALLRREGGGTNQLAFRAVAFAAAKVFTEGVKQSGRRLSRAGLINAIEHLRDFKTGVLPPLTFGPNRRLGVAGAYIVGVDSANKRLTPLSDLIELKVER
jgi:ABC-type branched-subunit amino acid transport system substrate-binding protein/cytochrome c553